MDRVFITPEQAANCLNEGAEIHTFVNPSGMLIGADWRREIVIKTFAEADKIEIGGDQCRKMKHGLVVHRKGGGLLFVEANEEKINELDPLPTSQAK
jgi:hypothetical protein